VSARAGTRLRTGDDRRRKLVYLLTVFVTAILPPGGLVAQSEDIESLREEFRTAHADAASGINITDERDSRALRSYALYPYLRAVRIERQLLNVIAAEDDADIAAESFLMEYGSAPLTFKLHRRWLESLARRGAWPKFLANYRSEIASMRLHCQYLSARVALDRTGGLAPDIVDRWLMPSQLPIECESAFQWLRAEDILDAALTEQRIRLLLENGQTGFARVIARNLPNEQAAPLFQWARLLQNPIVEFDRLIATPEMGVSREALISAWTRFARTNPTAALERFELVLSTLEPSKEDANTLALELAFGLAWDRRGGDAIDLFGRVDEAHLDDYALGWLARSALWVGDWRLVEQAIASMSTSSRTQTVWRYWTARSLYARKREEEARPLFRSVMADDNYYSAMAGAYLGEPVRPHLVTLRHNESVASELSASPAFTRAYELFMTGLRTEATREWREAIATLNEVERRQSVRIAAAWGWHDMAVATATQQSIFNDYDLLYPQPFTAEVQSAANLTGLEQALIYAVLRQESLFREDAVSAAGAIGLAQLQLDTARGTAGRWQLPVPDRAHLFEPGVNIRLGAGQLQLLLDRFENQLPVALAGYNAGPNAAARWLPTQSMDPDIWLENVPYNETRAYVRRVLWHSLVFGWNENGEAQDTAAWLQPVLPISSN